LLTTQKIATLAGFSVVNTDINVETVYEGSTMCRRCGHLMTPLETMYSNLGLCPDCRNLEYEKHAKRKMSEE